MAAVGREGRYQGIQILRFFCAAAVVVYHSVAQVRERAEPSWNEVPWSHFANVGVLFFFAISGFVLTQALQKETIGRYLLLRVLRIYPAFLAAVALIAAFRWIYGIGIPIPESPLTYILLLPAAPGPSGFVLGGVEWTLKHEIFYYGLLAALWAPRRELVVQVALAAWAAAIGWVAWHSPGMATKPFPAPSEFVFSTTHLPFIAGVFAYLHRQRLALAPGATWSALVIFVAGYEFFLHTEAKYLCVALAALFALPAVAAARIDSSLPANRVLIAFGDGSYGLYLLHMPILLMLVGNLVYQHYPDAYVVVFSIAVAGGLGLAFGAAEAAWYRWVRRRVQARARPSAGLDPVPEHL